MTVITESIGKDKDGKDIFVERELDEDVCQCDQLEPQAQHVYHHYSPAPMRITVSMRVWGDKVEVSGKSVDEVISVLHATVDRLNAEFTTPADKK